MTTQTVTVAIVVGPTSTFRNENNFLSMSISTKKIISGELKNIL